MQAPRKKVRWTSATPCCWARASPRVVRPSSLMSPDWAQDRSRRTIFGRWRTARARVFRVSSVAMLPTTSSMSCISLHSPNAVTSSASPTAVRSFMPVSSRRTRDSLSILRTAAAKASKTSSPSSPSGAARIISSSPLSPARSSHIWIIPFSVMFSQFSKSTSRFFRVLILARVAPSTPTARSVMSQSARLIRTLSRVVPRRPAHKWRTPPSVSMSHFSKSTITFFRAGLPLKPWARLRTASSCMAFHRGNFSATTSSWSSCCKPPPKLSAQVGLAQQSGRPTSNSRRALRSANAAPRDTRAPSSPSVQLLLEMIRERILKSRGSWEDRLLRVQAPVCSSVARISSMTLAKSFPRSQNCWHATPDRSNLRGSGFSSITLRVTVASRSSSSQVSSE
mmetsp:Transcript_3830/g.8511  ORF Transcript_3830/g.8511 Transcript_3830/m.8511 type:complete len:395 (-) Transcript_3830:309-1493(-)